MDLSGIFFLLSWMLLSTSVLAQKRNIENIQLKQCSAGFRLRGTLCQDINECRSNRSIKCGKNALCQNTQGSFKCTCNYGFTGDGLQCLALRNPESPTCLLGFTLDAKQNVCINQRKCQNNPRLCPIASTCTKVAQRYRCICAAGYKMIGAQCVSTSGNKENSPITTLTGRRIGVSMNPKRPSGRKLKGESSGRSRKPMIIPMKSMPKVAMTLKPLPSLQEPLLPKTVTSMAGILGSHNTTFIHSSGSESTRSTVPSPTNMVNQRMISIPTSSSSILLSTHSPNITASGTAATITATTVTIAEASFLPPTATLSTMSSSSQQSSFISTTAPSQAPLSPLLSSTQTPGTLASDKEPTMDDLCKGLTNSEGLRVRMEWRELSKAQRNNYIEAIREVVRRGEWSKNMWFHEQPSTNLMVHASNHFLHWHRHFAFQWENQLRELGGKFSCITLPYWDWTMDVKADMFQRPNISVVTDMGGLTEGNECLDFFGPVRYGQDDCITRPMNSPRGWRPPGPIEVASGIVSPTYFYDMSFLHKGWHAIIHNRIGGTMQNGMYSANDPLFFLHHAQVDKLFATWQACHDTSKDPGVEVPDHVYEESLGVLEPHGFDTMFAVWHLKGHKITPRMVNSIEKMGYTYSNDKMDKGSSWAPLGQCRYRVPWYNSHKRRRSTTEDGTSNTTTLQPVPFTELFDKSQGGEERDIFQVAKTAEKLYNTANDALGTKDNVMVLKLAMRLECERFDSYGHIEEPWGRILSIRNYTMPCYRENEPV